MVTTLSDDQERLLAKHAAARNITPAQALQTLLQADPPRHKRWTPQELEQVRNPRNSPASIARATGRTTAAVSVKRHQLALSENRPELLRRSARKPPVQ